MLKILSRMPITGICQIQQFSFRLNGTLPGFETLTGLT